MPTPLFHYCHYKVKTFPARNSNVSSSLIRDFGTNLEPCDRIVTDLEPPVCSRISACTGFESVWYGRGTQVLTSLAI